MTALHNTRRIEFSDNTVEPATSGKETRPGIFVISGVDGPMGAWEAMG